MLDRRVLVILVVGALATAAFAAAALAPSSLVAVLAAPQVVAGGGAMPPPPPAPPPGGFSAAPSGPIPEGTGAVSGVITDLATGKPLGGAQVQLVGGRGLPNGRQLTDEQGRFIFSKLPPGDTYVLRASRLGYADSRNDMRVVLVDGQWIADAKIALPKLGSIGGTIVDENGEPVVGISVRVLSRILVSGLPQLAAGAVAKTDDRGVYRIAGLQPGKYLVHVPSIQWSAPAGTSDATLSGMSPENLAQMQAAGRSMSPRHDQTLSPDGRNLLFLGGGALPPPSPANGGRMMAYPVMFYPSARAVTDAALIDLGRGEDRAGIDVQLRPVATVRVSGLVDTSAGGSAAGVTARLVPAGLESLALGAEAATALVAQDGSFTFLNVPAGTYQFMAGQPSVMEFQTLQSGSFGASLPTPPGWRPSSSGSGTVASAPPGTNYSFRNTSGSNGYSARSTVTVGATDMTGIVVPMKHAVSLSGRIVAETTNDPTSTNPPSPQRPPAFPFPVYAEPANADASLGMPSARVTITPPESTFTLEGLQPGQYVLRFLGNVVKSITVDGKDFTTKPLDTTSGHDITDVVVTVTDKSPKLSGQVKDARGQAARSGSVILFPIDRDQWTGYGFSPTRIVSLTVGNDGSYVRNGNLRAGEYFVIAVDESLATAWQDPKFLEAAAPLASRVSLDWTDTKTVDLSIKTIPGYRTPGGRP